MSLDHETRGGSIDPEDINTIVSFLNDQGDRTYTTEWFRWKYLDNPWADFPHARLVTNGGDISGFLGLVPIRFRVGHNEIPAAVIGDVVSSSTTGRTDMGDELSAFLEETAATVIHDVPLPTSQGPCMTDASVVTGENIAVRINQLSNLVGPPIEWFDPVYRRAIRLQDTIRRQVSGIERSLIESSLDVIRVPGAINDVRELAKLPSAKATTLSWSAETFEWRHDNPDAHYETYLMYAHGSLECTIVTERLATGDTSVVLLTDIRSDPSGQRMDGGISSMIGLLLHHHCDADVILCPSHPVLKPALEDFGFLSLDSPLVRSVIDWSDWRVETNGSDTDRERSMIRPTLATAGLGW